MAPFRLSVLGLTQLLLLPSVSGLPSQHSVRDLAYTPLGCFTDLANGQRAINDKNAATNDMTVESCAAFCSNYAFFGLEYGRECYCGNSRDSGSTEADANDCSFSCAGDPSGVQRCGAGNRLNLYSNSNYAAAAPASLPDIASLGCFVDSAQRVLPDKIIGANDMTAAKCAANCVGYSYFGTQWSSECYCGNTVPSVSAPASECNMLCSGKGDEVCGGSLRLNVYKLPSTANNQPSTSATEPAIPPVSGFEYKGCYSDGIPQRVLAGKVVNDPSMTIEMCAEACKNWGYTWFGVEYTTECYCGTALDGASTKVAGTECSMSCGGNNSQKCGAANRISVFASLSAAGPATNSLSVAGFQYGSCWTDKVDDRSLKAVDYRTDDMTAEKCAERCQGYAYFGLEYSRECYCGDQLGGQTAPEKECGMLCMGSANQWCGGPDRLNVYTRETASASSSTHAVSSSSSSTVDPISSSTSSQMPSSDSVSPSLTISSTASSAQSSTSDLISSSDLSSSTTVVSSTSTSSGPDMTTITNCPAAPTYNGSPEFCYLTGSLPVACQTLSKGFNNFRAMSTSLSSCSAQINRMKAYGATAIPQATACFPSLRSNQSPPNAADGTATAISVYSCLLEPTNSVACQVDSECKTSTYVVGQVPSPTPSIGVNLLKDGGFESGTTGEWVGGASNPHVQIAVNGARPRSGSYSLTETFLNTNGATYAFTRTMKVTPGRTYTFQVPYWNSNPAALTSLYLYVYPNVFATDFNTAQLYQAAANQWLARTITFTATSSWVQILFSFGGNVGGGVNQIYIDDISFVRLN
ncbi:uncharacterized protein CTRU02_209354 [Colletotrichum truncatum]|uniref:Uncharacterized protein n=1 Tax=Colletotrichum truncatum TaxID=5467 RepID=A0ACC3YS40_COLTU|nr:uncharacterized protein CTRU02_08571 [Colletotrichum truncatum]KAF6789872.1 hypothetical protein CTRU02_08571 [Colletotrichum truncatum]